MVFQCINIRQVLREVLKTAASCLGFQHLPRDLANVNAWKTLFDPYTTEIHVLNANSADVWFWFTLLANVPLWDARRT